VNRPIRLFAAALLLFLCGGCANRYFAWNTPLPTDQEHGFVQTGDANYSYPVSSTGWLNPPNRSDPMKSLCRELGKQGIACPAPAHIR
jgi:hypothetical protein